MPGYRPAGRSDPPGLLLGRIAQSDFSWVSSNVRYVPGKNVPPQPFSQRLTNVHETMLLDVGGVKVGLFALTVVDANGDGLLTIAELVQAVNNALNSCPAV